MSRVVDRRKYILAHLFSIMFEIQVFCVRCDMSRQVYVNLRISVEIGAIQSMHINLKLFRVCLDI